MQRQSWSALVLIATLCTATAAQANGLDGPNPAHLRQLMRTGSCEGCMLQNANLRGMNLRRANLRFSDLQGADLTGADLAGADLTGALISFMHDRSSLRGANLNRAKLDNAKVIAADLRGASLRRASMQVADLSSRMTYADLYKVQMAGSHPNEWASLQAVNLYSASLGACADEAQEIEQLPSVLEVLKGEKEASWRGTQKLQYKLNAANPNKATFAFADMRRADLGSVDFSETNLVGADIRGAMTIGTMPAIPQLYAKGATVGNNSPIGIGGEFPACNP